MEGSESQQRLQIAQDAFPVGAKVCNTRIGNVGIVCGKPFFERTVDSIFIPVAYSGQEFFEDTRTLITVRSVKKGALRNT